MKPGPSFASITVLPIASPVARASASASLEDSTPAITSSRRITGAGLKKCIPTTRSGRLAAAAIAVTSNEDVLVASTHCSLTISRQRAVELVLEVKALGHGLDHELTGSECAEVLDRLKALGRRPCVPSGEATARGFFLKARTRALDALLERLGDRIMQQRLRARATCKLGDPRAHRARAEDSDHSSRPARRAGRAGLLILPHALLLGHDRFAAPALRRARAR